MIACARQERLFLMEAMWTRFLPGHGAAEGNARFRRTGGNPPYRRELFLCLSLYPRQPGVRSRPGRRRADGRGGVSAVRLLHAPGPAGSLAGFRGIGPQRGGSARLHAAGLRGIHLPVHGRGGCGGRQAACASSPPGAWWRFRISGRAPSFIFAGKEFVFPPETEGHHHQFEHAAACIARDETESPVMPLEETAFLMNLIFQMRREMGVIFPGD